MKHVTQDFPGDVTCLPAVIAMIKGVPKSDVRAFGLKWAREHCEFPYLTWSEVYWRNIDFWRIAQAIADHFGFNMTAIRACATNFFAPIGSTRALPPGRGTILLFGHIVAYEDGQVYDPNLDSPMAWAEWYACHGHAIVLIQPEEP